MLPSTNYLLASTIWRSWSS